MFGRPLVAPARQGHRCGTEPPQAVSAFRDGMLSLAAHGTYVEIVAGMAAAEWMYLTWSRAAH